MLQKSFLFCYARSVFITSTMNNVLGIFMLRAIIKPELILYKPPFPFSASHPLPPPYHFTFSVPFSLSFSPTPFLSVRRFLSPRLLHLLTPPPRPRLRCLPARR